MEKGSQWVGIKECSTDTVAIPPIVPTSLAMSAIASAFLATPTILYGCHYGMLHLQQTRDQAGSTAI